MSLYLIGTASDQSNRPHIDRLREKHAGRQLDRHCDLKRLSKPLTYSDIVYFSISIDIL